MTTDLRTKIRALIVDPTKNGFETFTYVSSNIFTIAEPNLGSITKVLINDQETTNYSFDADTNKITITEGGLSTDDEIEVDYTYTQYSNTELDESIRAALVWLSIFDYASKDYELENGDIYPTPDNQSIDLISLVASILIQPDYNSYNSPTITVRYPNKMPKEDRIAKIVSHFKMGLGVNGILSFE